jgi:hypothetical protein
MTFSSMTFVLLGTDTRPLRLPFHGTHHPPKPGPHLPTHHRPHPATKSATHAPAVGRPNASTLGRAYDDTVGDAVGDADRGADPEPDRRPDRPADAGAGPIMAENCRMERSRPLKRGPAALKGSDVCVDAP